MITKEEALKLLWERPIEVGHWVGFKDLTEINNEWLRDFLYEDKDQTKQGHRGSYKTTTLSLFLALHTLEKPNETVMYFRKTDTDVAEIARQTSKILQSGCVQMLSQAIYGRGFKITKDSNSELQTDLTTSILGASQIVGLGIGTSITGKHADIVVTDDIVNIKDRISRAERERTKIAYQELENVKNRGGRFINTGTPWHKDDAFILMPKPKRYDCYSTGLMTDEQIKAVKDGMTASLFAANYELRHIAAEDVIFSDPIIEADPALAEQGLAHVDAAYGGEDYTALTIAKRRNGKLYIFGKLWQKSVEALEETIISYRKAFMASQTYCEDNADKGFLARDLRKKGERVITYHEDMNKFLKITSYLKSAWRDVIFVKGTDPEYIEQICDYNENAEHDDAPDSLASIVRIYSRKSDTEYKPLWN